MDNLLADEEEILCGFIEALTADMGLIIEEFNEKAGENWVTPLLKVFIGEKSMDFERRPAGAVWIKRKTRTVADRFVDRWDFDVTIRIVFDDSQMPCVGFRYAKVLGELLNKCERLKEVCDLTLLEEMNYFQSKESEEPAEVEFKIRVVREGF